MSQDPHHSHLHPSPSRLQGCTFPPPASQDPHPSHVHPSPRAKPKTDQEAGPTALEVQKNAFVVGMDPVNTHIVTIAAPKREEDGSVGNLRQKDISLLRLS